MSLALAPLWCIALLALMLFAAAAEDAVRMKISNRTTGAILILTIATMIVVGLTVDVWQNAVVFAGLLFAGTLMFAAGKLGGGDVKLLAVCGLWFTLLGGIKMLLAVFLAGGLLAAIILIWRALRRGKREGRILFLYAGSGIPYGIAIAIGMLLAVGYERWEASRPEADPLGLPSAISTL